MNDRRIGYFTNITNLIQQIQSDTRFSISQEPFLFSFYNRNQKTIRDLNKEAASFMWTHMLIDVLKQIPKDKKAMEEMLLMCQECYRDNPVQLNLIEQFRRTYESHHAIRWYTKDCFLYRLLNKALRTEDTDALYIFRAFIIDLCTQLEEEKRLCLCSSPTFTVYRGQMMFDWELKKLIDNIGHLVSANAFFSASLNENVGEVFAGHGEFTDSHEKSVILQIEVKTQLRHTLAVSIAHLSEMPAENEVLFSLSSVFKVLNVCEESDNNRWRVYLQTTDEGREVVDEYKHVSLTDDECPTSEIVFGRLLMNMGQCAQAVNYFTSLASRLDAAHAHDVALRAAINCGQCECLYHMGKYEEARQCSEKGLALFDNLGMSSTNILYLRCRYYLANASLLTNKIQEAAYILEETLREQQYRLNENHVHIADTLRAIGLMIGLESGFDKSLKVRQEALRIYEKALPENHPKRISALVSLAGSYEATGEFRLALDYLYQALHMQERYLLDEHSSRAVTLRSLAVVHEALDERDVAFDYYIRAYSIWMLLYPNGHRYTAFCLNKIGGIYCDGKQFSEALQCQIQALEMRTKLSNNDTSQPYTSLGRTYLNMGDNIKAIETLHLACDYWKAKSSNPSNKYLNGIESILATAYSHNGEYNKAQEIFDRVYFSQKNANPEGNPDIGYTLHHMASNLMRMGEYNHAIECYQKSLDILLNYFSENHREVIMVREKMATVETLMRKVQQD
ncbi:unnamed protein product [Adineta steineri]|uniref:NAD(P)(+)--arginine ADP-ribosyltransferase n=1 Tax=Adineta steineri TaxID=433720 RepID=A0A819BGV3_9BILA|nr:unnamed protein product [Adineta steineri]CAF3798008.1 unnamed protein product [Adineta steineri]